jgi:hypothetical protein
MKKDKVGWWKRNIMYYAVKYFGKSSWNSYSKTKIKKNSKFVEVVEL